MSDHYQINHSRSIGICLRIFCNKFFFIKIIMSMIVSISASNQPTAGFENMNLIIMGPPGCGKGTQSRKISARYNINHITSGKLLREAAQRGDELSEFLKAELSNGKLIPDEIVNDIVKQKVPCSGFILDGYPRRISQVATFSQIDLVIVLDISDAECIARIVSRNDSRSDDNIGVAQKRLLDYKSEAESIKEYYSKKGVLEVIDGLGTVDEVFNRIVNVIERRLVRNE